MARRLPGPPRCPDDGRYVVHLGEGRALVRIAQGRASSESCARTGRRPHRRWPLARPLGAATQEGPVDVIALASNPSLFGGAALDGMGRGKSSSSTPCHSPFGRSAVLRSQPRNRAVYRHIYIYIHTFVYIYICIYIYGQPPPP